MSDHDDQRTPSEELLDRARSTLDRRRATMAALEERHTRLREARQGHGRGEAQGAPASASADPIRELWRARTVERWQIMAERTHMPTESMRDR